MVIGKRAILATVVIGAIGVTACVVRTTPVHRGRPGVVEKHKHEKHKDKREKHKDHHGHE